MTRDVLRQNAIQTDHYKSKSGLCDFKILYAIEKPVTFTTLDENPAKKIQFEQRDR